MHIDGHDVFFYHLRNYTQVREVVERDTRNDGATVEVAVVLPQISSRGGTTYAFINDNKGNVYYNFAKCSEDDNFHKKFGRALAYHRLTETPIPVDLEDEPCWLNTASGRKALFNYMFEEV